MKAPELFGCSMFEGCESFHARNAGLLALILLTVYFAWKRRLGRARCLLLALPFAAAALFANIYPFSPEGSTEVLTVLHMPIALWLAVGFAHAGAAGIPRLGAWSSSAFPGRCSSSTCSSPSGAAC